MNFDPSRVKAVELLNNFINTNLSNYSKLRNFDFGPDKRSNTSCLSPYITHGVLSEKEVMHLSLKKTSFTKIEKFIQEVLWRIYWKGWLELRPDVWRDYIMDLNRLRQEYKDDKNYLDKVVESKELHYHPDEFIAMYNEDQLGGLIRNVEFWIKDVFANLVIKK